MAQHPPSLHIAFSQYSAIMHLTTKEHTSIVETDLTCLFISLSRLQRPGILPRTIYWIAHTLPMNQLRRAGIHLFLLTIFCSFPRDNYLSRNNSSCVLIPLLAHVLSVCRSIRTLYYGHGKMLATRAYLPPLSLRVPRFDFSDYSAKAILRPDS